MKHLLTILLLFISISSFAQEKDTIPDKRKGEFVILPVAAYTPETNFLVGAYTQYYFDFAKDTTARMSNFQVGGIYTIRKQMFFGGEVNLFSKEEKYIGTIRTKYSKFTDRDYGLGNDALAVVHQYDAENQQLDSMNFLDFQYQSYGLEVMGLRKIKKYLYVGGHYWFEKLWDYGRIADSLSIVETNIERDEFNSDYLSGTRSGIALMLAYDTRKNSNNPLEGTFIQFRNWHYGGWLGSDYDYISVSLDARHYINTYKKQVLAMRFINEQKYPLKGSLIPKFDLARVGGKDFARGYYEGTYIDNHMLAFQIEYRIPLWQKPNAKFWELWKKLGMVVFASGSRVYEKWEDFSLRDMRFTVGVGGRMILSEEQRVNARFDIGYGLDPNAGFNKRNLGIYVFISEAF
jgi:hypothetical protein